MINILRQIRKGISNLIYYFPIIWEDRDWDYCYIYVMIEAKLERMIKYWETSIASQYAYLHVGSESDLRYMRIALRLLQTIKNEELMYEYANKVENNNVDDRSEILRYYIEKEKKVKRLFWKIMNEKLERWWI
jgi:hypothetical protein